MISLNTEAGSLTIVRARSADPDAVMTILREAADWLSARGNQRSADWFNDESAALPSQSRQASSQRSARHAAR